MLLKLFVRPQLVVTSPPKVMGGYVFVGVGMQVDI